MTRRIPAGDGVYNLAATHDGKLLVGTNKRGQSVSVIDIASAARSSRAFRPRARSRAASSFRPTTATRSSRVEGVGSQPGTVDVIDLRRSRKVASVDVGQQAGGIDFWKSEAPRK